MAAEQNLNVTWTADFSDVQAAFESVQNSAKQAFSAVGDSASGAAQSFEKMGSSMKDSIGGIGGALEDIKAKISTAFQFAGIAAGIEAIQLLQSEVQKLGDRATQINLLSSTIGETVEQFQAMQHAAEATGVSSEVLTRATERLANLLNEAGQGSGGAIDKLRQLGVTTEQLSDSSFNVVGVLETVKARLNDSSTAAETQAALLQTLGVRGATAAQAIKALDLSESGVQKAMNEVNGLTDYQTKRLQEMGTWWKQLGTEIENTTSKLLVSATDAAKALATGWNKPGLLGNVTDSSQLSGNAAQVNAATDATKQQEAMANEVAEVVITGSKNVTKAYLDDLHQQLVETQQGTADKLALAKEYYSASLEYYGKGTVDAVRSAHEQMIAEERAYQAKRVEMEQQSTAALNALTAAQSTIIRQEMAEANQALDDITEQTKAKYKEQEDAVIASLEAQKAAIESSYQTGAIGPRTELSQLQSVLQQELAAREAYYAQAKALAAGNEKELAALQAQEAQVQGQYLVQMQKATDKAAQEFKQQWGSVINTFASSFASNMEKVIAKTETFGTAMKNLFSSVFESIIQKLVGMVTQWIENLIIAKLTNQTTAISQVSANAGVAASAAMASVAAIPYVGWAMAPEVGAATAAQALSFGSLASAAGGMEVPMDMIANLHKNEMVLPRHLSDGIRNMIANQAGGGGANGDVHNHNWNVSAMDGKSLKKMFDTAQGKKAIADSMKSAYRRGRRR
jgi:hypothetical protein